jgi:SNF2 family DNA or RNA helicase
MRAQLDNEQGPLVTFFQHTAVRDVFKDLVIGARIGVIDGKTTRNKINAAVQAFQQRELDLLLVQTQAGGMGLTLTASNVANVTEIPWTATALKQALARIHRKTQTRDCFAKVMRAENCWLEDAMAKTVGKKQKASAELLGFLTTSE